jgi:DNA-binding NtrC family response regulator
MNTDIVIVDECELIKVSLEKVLKGYRGNIWFYYTLEDALNAFKVSKKQKSYIFLLDLEVVTYNGLQQLMSVIPKDQCKIILLTSMPITYVEKAINRECISGIFAKPFNVKELAETVHHLSQNL